MENTIGINRIGNDHFSIHRFSRWIFTIPQLVNSYMQPTTDPSLKNNIEMLYSMLNTYSGMAIGEHLGFITMAFWTVSLAMIIPFHQLYKWAGFTIALLLLISLSENFGGPYAPLFGQLNFIANCLWSVWLMAVGRKFYCST